MKNGSQLPPHIPPGLPPLGAVAADQTKLVHINTYGDLPEFYVDYQFTCKDCNREETWTAERQKWYYEEAKGHIWALAIQCYDCRRSRRGIEI